jgi:hypothetical protein
MAYDRADWHYNGNFPEVPQENGATHIGMFLAWAILNGLEGDLHKQEFAESLQLVRERKMSGREFLMKNCDGKFWEEDLNDVGNAFAKSYYNREDGYFEDYFDILGDSLPSIYYVEDTWENFEKISEEIDRQFAQWKALQGTKDG